MNPAVGFSRAEPPIHFNVELLHTTVREAWPFGSRYCARVKFNTPDVKLWGLVQRDIPRVSWVLCCQLTPAVFQNTATDVDFVRDFDEHERLGTYNTYT